MLQPFGPLSSLGSSLTICLFQTDEPYGIGANEAAVHWTMRLCWWGNEQHHTWYRSWLGHRRDTEEFVGRGKLEAVVHLFQHVSSWAFPWSGVSKGDAFPVYEKINIACWLQKAIWLEVWHTFLHLWSPGSSYLSFYFFDGVFWCTNFLMKSNLSLFFLLVVCGLKVYFLFF